MHFTSKRKVRNPPSTWEYRLDLLNHQRVLSFDNDACVGCGLCVHACPIGEGVVSMGTSPDEQVVIDLDRCVHCGACDYFCPAGALSLSINGEPRIELREPAGEIPRTSLPDLHPVVLARVDGKVPGIKKHLGGALHVPALDSMEIKAAIASCPTGALAERDDGIRVDETRCFFCDACSRATGGKILVSRNRLLADLEGGVSPLVKRVIERMMGPLAAARLLKGTTGKKARVHAATIVEALGKR